MGLMNSLRISSSSLQAQRLRMDLVANNVANSNTTGAVNGVSIFDLGGADGNVCAGGVSCP